ncbi:MAG: FliM/FliN family flagellar motor C-terminal domain-containing protein [Candidatus Korobacteraceae bacterium]|jgi:flagellar motor switch protein FliN/FliY
MADSDQRGTVVESVDTLSSVAKFSCRMSLEIPVPRFTVRDLLRLSPDDVIDTCWAQTADVPLRINGLLLSWAEFELIGNKMAVRLTELE